VTRNEHENTSNEEKEENTKDLPIRYYVSETLWYSQSFQVNKKEYFLTQTKSD
jgi:hypothetical protein